jgi:hypothetical protein
LQALGAVLKEFQEIHEIQFLPFLALHFYPHLSEEGIALNIQLLDFLEDAVLKEDE